MATILLTAVGTLAGGPVGGAIGAIVGQQIDAAIIGSPGRQGPRLKELAVTTSSYGQPLPRHFGRMRAPGSVIWATDLVENSETSGGGKGKPKTTTFSYSVSFAVALSSRPIRSVGRIWADGNLLRGSAGDLKTAGTLRVYNGYGDQLPDPLIAAAEGLQNTAFRGIAYAVFENLALGDFGNRIPALTFEIIAEEQGAISLADIAPGTVAIGSLGELPALAGFSDEGGELAGTLGSIDQLFELAIVAEGNDLLLSRIAPEIGQVAVLPEEVVSAESEGSAGGQGRERTHPAYTGAHPFALRYYDQARDYQIGVQRALGDQQTGQERTIEFPGALTAEDARSLTLAMAQVARWRKDRLSWRIAELNSAFAPGQIVRLADQPGYWMISSWEWLDRGVELALERTATIGLPAIPSDSGRIPPPADLPLASTRLWTFELPPDGTGQQTTGSYFAALSADSTGWAGASLYLDQGGNLLPLGAASRVRSVAGALVSSLEPSNSLYLEQGASIEVDLVANDFSFSPSTISGLAIGANRLLIGHEVIQFVNAEQLTATRWKLSGLLRGRGGTEHIALLGHLAGSQVVLLDESIVPLDPELIAGSNSTIAAIGLGDEQPVESLLNPDGVSRNPPAPVHPSREILSNGDWKLCWTRRARGQWRWLDLVEVPLVEEGEQYELGIGATEAPVASWITTTPNITLSAAVIGDLAAASGNAQIWVRQIGTYGKSPATFIASLE